MDLESRIIWLLEFHPVLFWLGVLGAIAIVVAVIAAVMARRKK